MPWGFCQDLQTAAENGLVSATLILNRATQPTISEECFAGSWGTTECRWQPCECVGALRGKKASSQIVIKITREQPPVQTLLWIKLLFWDASKALLRRNVLDPLFFSFLQRRSSFSGGRGNGFDIESILSLSLSLPEWLPLHYSQNNYAFLKRGQKCYICSV